MRRFAPLLVSVLAAIALAACDRDEPVPTPTLTAAPEDDRETAATLELVADRTEDLLALDGGAGPEITLLDDEALARLIEELLEEPESIESLRRDEAFYSLLGLIPPGTDLLELNEELLNAGIAGLYRPELDHLYVRLFGQFSSLEEATAAHEYAHYLQDVGYDLDAMFDAVAGDRDAELALRALIEGDASYIEQQYVDEHFNAVQLFGMGFGGLLAASEAPSVPYVFTQETTFVYLDGQLWIGEILASGVTREALYARPPLTTSEVLHPERYGAATSRPVVPLEVATHELPGGWHAGEPETIGELVLTIWLQELGGIGTVRAADGWIGDALLVFRTDDEPAAFVSRVRWRDSDEAEEFHTVATDALDSDDRHAATACRDCAFEVWESPAGVLTLFRADPTSEDVMIAAAPSIEDLQRLIAAVR